MKKVIKEETDYESLAKEYESKYRYALADADNIRKQATKKINTANSEGKISVIKAILPIIDDCERGLEYENDKEGVSIILTKLRSTLRQMGVEEMEVVGEEFDPIKHEAIANSFTTDERYDGVITESVVKGYTYDGEIIRYPKVVVGKLS